MKKRNFIFLILYFSIGFTHEPFIGEIRMFAGNYAPQGWALCDGQLLLISSNQSLFSILGTTYGGDGRTNFGLPDLRGRVSLHAGTGPGLSSRGLGSKSGTEQTTLQTANMPAHSHAVSIHVDTSVATSGNPKGGYLAQNAASTPQFGGERNDSLAIDAATTSNVGEGEAVSNMPPFLTVNYIIALEGTFPSRN